MFTGIIESIGRIESIKKNGGDIALSIQYDNTKITNLEVGDSVSVNGACLTLVNFNNKILDESLRQKSTKLEFL